MKLFAQPKTVYEGQIRIIDVRPVYPKDAFRMNMEIMIELVDDKNDGR